VTKNDMTSSLCSIVYCFGYSVNKMGRRCSTHVRAKKCI